MDDADMTQERSEKEAELLLAASRRPEGPKPTGFCLFCGEELDAGRRWCDAEHRDAWERQK